MQLLLSAEEQFRSDCYSVLFAIEVQRQVVSKGAAIKLYPDKVRCDHLQIESILDKMKRDGLLAFSEVKLEQEDLDPDPCRTVVDKVEYYEITVIDDAKFSKEYDQLLKDSKARQESINEDTVLKNSEQVPPPQENEIVQNDDPDRLVLSADGAVFYKNKRLEIYGQQLKMLVYFIKHINVVLSKDQLAVAILDKEYDPARFFSEKEVVRRNRSVYSCINVLSGQLQGQVNRYFIETHKRAGYMLKEK